MKNYAYWESKRDEYPFHAEVEKDKSPKPDGPFSFRGDFIAVPMPEIGVVWWGFKNQRDRDDFAKEYDVTNYNLVAR